METSSQLLLSFLLNACWQLALIVAVASFCDWLLRETAARYRHWLWVAALVLSLCLPVLASLRALNGALSGRQSLPAAAAKQVVLLPVASSQSLTPDTTPASRTPALPQESNALISINRSWAAILITLYFLILFRRSVKLLAAWRRTRAITRNADEVDSLEQLQTAIHRCQKAIGVTRVGVRSSASVLVPVTVGNLKPLVILPEYLLREADANILTSAIGHELVHISRRDYLLNLIYELIYLPLSFHPATVLMRRRINQTRELGCDELVTEKLLDAEVYARSLIQLASAAIPLRSHTNTITVGIADADILEERVMTMIKRSKPNVGRRSWLLIAATLCLAVPCLAAAPFALRVNVNSPPPAVTSHEVAVLQPEVSATPQQDAAQEAKRAKQEAEQKEQRERSAAREGKAEYQGQVYEVRLQGGQGTQGVAYTVHLEPSQEARERKERVEQMVKEALEQDPTLDVRAVRAGIEKRMAAARIEERAREEREAQDPEIIAHRRAEREAMAKQKAELVKEARITMPQAIQIVTNQYPGTVLESRLVREGPQHQASYILTILSDNGGETTTTRVLMSAIDGSIINAMKQER